MKWRLPEKAPFPLESQQDAFSSESPEKHEHGQNNPADCKTDLAARWLASQAVPPHPVVPVLRRTFDLSPKEACEACKLAYGLRRAS